MWYLASVPTTTVTAGAVTELRAAERFEGYLRGVGLDLVHWFRPTPLDHETLTLPPSRPGTWGVLIANSAALWEPFTRARPDLPLDNPLDEYVEREVRSALRTVGSEEPWLRFAHEMKPTPFPFQRLAHAVGFAHLGPAHLSVHEIHGPWVALRAVALLDLDPRDAPERASERAGFDCTGCAAPCTRALARALATPPAIRSPDPILQGGLHQLSERARRFVEVRTVCPVGRQHSYGEAQIAFHYGALDRAANQRAR